MKLKVTPVDARRLFENLEHEDFQNAIPTHWEVYEDGHVSATSVLWLFCWAKTGMNSEEAAETAREIFNDIMDKPFEFCDEKVRLYDFAVKYRYHSDKQFVENNLAIKLGEVPYKLSQF